MLITSSQASVAMSMAIVVAFTLALFLSGYAIQQRTLRDLRAAIKPPPRPSPQIYLAENFGGSKAASSEVRQPREDPEKAQVVEIKHPDPAESSDRGSEMRPDSVIDSDAKPQKLLSRVERRKRIKAEIKKLSQGEAPVYYQRRLW